MKVKGYKICKLSKDMFRKDGGKFSKNNRNDSKKRQLKRDNHPLQAHRTAHHLMIRMNVKDIEEDRIRR